MPLYSQAPVLLPEPPAPAPPPSPPKFMLNSLWSRPGTGGVDSPPPLATVFWKYLGKPRNRRGNELQRPTLFLLSFLGLKKVASTAFFLQIYCPVPCPCLRQNITGHCLSWGGAHSRYYFFLRKFRKKAFIAKNKKTISLTLVTKLKPTTKEWQQQQRPADKTTFSDQLTADNRQCLSLNSLSNMSNNYRFCPALSIASGKFLNFSRKLRLSDKHAGR